MSVIRKKSLLNRLEEDGLVVSCQAHFDHPLNDPRIIAAMAQCAVEGGASGIRADGKEHIRAIKKQVDVPVIGIKKRHLHGTRFFITPTFEDAQEIVDAGSDMVALDATTEKRPKREELTELIHRIQTQLHVPVMADIATLDEGIRAYECGATLVSTTLSGYTESSRNAERPDLPLVSQLAEKHIPVVCEGNIQNPKDARRAIERGARFCVIGTAITDPIQITSRFHQSLPTSEK